MDASHSSVKLFHVQYNQKCPHVIDTNYPPPTNQGGRLISMAMLRNFGRIHIILSLQQKQRVLQQNTSYCFQNQKHGIILKTMPAI